MILKLDLFGPVTREETLPIVVAQAEKPQIAGWHKALDWTGTEVMFFGFWCQKCGQRFNTPLLKDVGRSYKCALRHCGKEDTVTISELMAANLPTARTEPNHHQLSGVLNIKGNNVLSVGDFGGEDGEVRYDGVNAGPKETEDPQAQLDGMLF